MIKVDIVNEVSKVADITKVKSEAAVDAVFDAMRMSMKRGGDASALLSKGPSMREFKPETYLKEEIQGVKSAVKDLDEAVTMATALDERTSQLLAEAYRALSRLEQVCLRACLGVGSVLTAQLLSWL